MMAYQIQPTATASGKQIIQTDMTGTVVDYKLERGYGFVDVPNNGRYFMNIAEVQNPPKTREGKRYVQVKQIVKGDIAQGRKGLEFVNIHLTKDFSSADTVVPTLKRISLGMRPAKISFEESVWEEVLCPICQQLMVDPLETSCHHVFCGTCIQKWLSRQAACPVTECSKPGDTSTLTPVTPNFAKLLQKAKQLPFDPEN